MTWGFYNHNIDVIGPLLFCDPYECDALITQLNAGEHTWPMNDPLFSSTMGSTFRRTAGSTLTLAPNAGVGDSFSGGGIHQKWNSNQSIDTCGDPFNDPFYKASYSSMYRAQISGASSSFSGDSWTFVVKGTGSTTVDYNEQWNTATGTIEVNPRLTISVNAVAGTFTATSSFNGGNPTDTISVNGDLDNLHVITVTLNLVESSGNLTANWTVQVDGEDDINLAHSMGVSNITTFNSLTHMYPIRWGSWEYAGLSLNNDHDEVWLALQRNRVSYQISSGCPINNLCYTMRETVKNNTKLVSAVIWDADSEDAGLGIDFSGNGNNQEEVNGAGYADYPRPDFPKNCTSRYYTCPDGFSGNTYVRLNLPDTYTFNGNQFNGRSFSMATVVEINPLFSSSFGVLQAGSVPSFPNLYVRLDGTATQYPDTIRIQTIPPNPVNPSKTTTASLTPFNIDWTIPHLWSLTFAGTTITVYLDGLPVAQQTGASFNVSDIDDGTSVQYMFNGGFVSFDTGYQMFFTGVWDGEIDHAALFSAYNSNLKSS